MPKVYLPFPPEQVVGDISWLVRHLRLEHIEKYHQEPHFVKIPIWVHKLLIDDYNSRVFTPINRSEPKIHTLIGLTVCPTVTIDSILDIEVF